MRTNGKSCARLAPVAHPATARAWPRPVLLAGTRHPELASLARCLASVRVLMLATINGELL
jgi:hypothetical protein